jgi:hypothetical protein
VFRSPSLPSNLLDQSRSYLEKEKIFRALAEPSADTPRALDELLYRDSPTLV